MVFILKMGVIRPQPGPTYCYKRIRNGIFLNDCVTRRKEYADTIATYTHIRQSIAFQAVGSTAATVIVIVMDAAVWYFWRKWSLLIGSDGIILVTLLLIRHRPLYIQQCCDRS
jgi:hypothetical protein